ncbi:MAG: DUF3891 family protein [Vicinamibacterales bacterium]
MIIRQFESTLQLISQPDHAALAFRIMRAWDVTHFPESPRNANDPEWRAFFSEVTAARDGYLRATGSIALSDLLADYRFVRAGDLASLAFCNQWTAVDADGCGYAMRLDGTSLRITPAPFGGRSIEIQIDAREIPNRGFASPVDAQRVVASAPIITLTGVVN